MAEDYRNDFSFVPSPLQDDTVRARLQQAILNDDPDQVRAILNQTSSQVLGQHRLYGVLVPTSAGMQTIMVDQTGRRLGSGDVINQNTPIDMVNVEYGPTEMTVTFDNQKWTRPYKQS